MEFEWHEAKRLKTIKERGLDFIDIDIVFGGPMIVSAAKTVNGEQRLMATGLLNDVYVTAVYTMRGEVTRIISLRKARDGERKRHQDLHGS